MAERVTKAKVVEEHIIACPQCRRSNRLHKRNAAGVYRCGACHAELPNPFPAHAIRTPSMRVVGIVAASIIAFLVIVVVIAGVSSGPRTPVQQDEIHKAAERDARVDKLITESGGASQTFNPAPAPPAEIPTVVPRNGILFDAYPGSTAQGEFTVINGASHHAIAKVIDIQTDRKILSFAICAGKRTKITAIPDGTYDVIFAFGDLLYVGTDHFEKARGFSKFDRPFTFTTRTTATETEEATHYRTTATALEVTLTPVIGGNITTSSISQEEFERY